MAAKLDKPPDHSSYHEALIMEAFAALHAPTTWDIMPTTIPWTTKGTMETLMRTEPSVKEGTHSITPQMHLAAGTTALFQWT